MKIFLYVVMFLISCSVLGQENNELLTDKKNVFTTAIAYTYIPSGTAQDNIQNGHFVPGIGIDYFRRIHPRFDIGVMADIELGSYVIPRKEDLIRERALVLALIGTYSISKDWAVFLGP